MFQARRLLRPAKHGLEVRAPPHRPSHALHTHSGTMEDGQDLAQHEWAQHLEAHLPLAQPLDPGQQLPNLMCVGMLLPVPLQGRPARPAPSPPDPSHPPHACRPAITTLIMNIASNMSNGNAHLAHLFQVGRPRACVSTAAWLCTCRGCRCWRAVGERTPIPTIRLRTCLARLSPQPLVNMALSMQFQVWQQAATAPALPDMLQMQLVSMAAAAPQVRHGAWSGAIPACCLPAAGCPTRPRRMHATAPIAGLTLVLPHWYLRTHLQAGLAIESNVGEQHEQLAVAAQHEAAAAPEAAVALPEGQQPAALEQPGMVGDAGSGAAQADPGAATQPAGVTAVSPAAAAAAVATAAAAGDAAAGVAASCRETYESEGTDEGEVHDEDDEDYSSKV